jgi:proteasome alpha subunit
VSGAGAGGVGTAVGADQLYRISYDGSIVDERRFVVMGGATEPVITALTASFTPGWDLPTALAAAVKALGTAGEGAPRELLPTQLEVAVLDRTLAGRTFRRVQGAVLAALLAGPAPVEQPADPESEVTLPAEPPVDADGASPESST